MWSRAGLHLKATRWCQTWTCDQVGVEPTSRNRLSYFRVFLHKVAFDTGLKPVCYRWWLFPPAHIGTLLGLPLAAMLHHFAVEARTRSTAQIASRLVLPSQRHLAPRRAGQQGWVLSNRRHGAHEEALRLHHDRDLTSGHDRADLTNDLSLVMLAQQRCVVCS